MQPKKIRPTPESKGLPQGPKREHPVFIYFVMFPELYLFLTENTLNVHFMYLKGGM